MSIKKREKKIIKDKTMENKGLIIRKPISIVEFWQLGREQRHKYENLLIKIFTFIFGPLGINSRIRSGHVLSILNSINLNEIRNVLDAGCGQSEILFWLAKRFPHLEGTGKELLKTKKLPLKHRVKTWFLSKEIWLTLPMINTMMSLSAWMYWST
jgi:hypothetical protein